MWKLQLQPNDPPFPPSVLTTVSKLYEKFYEGTCYSNTLIRVKLYSVGNLFRCHDMTFAGTSDKPEVVRKTVSRRKREERRPTQAVTADDIPSAPPKEGEKKKEEPAKQLAAPTLAVPSLPNGPTSTKTEEKKPRHAPVTVSISDSGAVVWDNSKKSPENETPSPVSNESASDKAEIVRKKVARKKRDERRSTQHVSKDDLPAVPDKEQPAAPAKEQADPLPAETSSKEKEDHLTKVIFHLESTICFLAKVIFHLKSTIFPLLEC